MKKHIVLFLFAVISFYAAAQIPAGEYLCHLNLNQPGSFTYSETGTRFFTISVSDKGGVSIKMNVLVREKKTAATNYVLFNGSATGTIENTGSFEATGTLVLSIYEREKMDTRWTMSSVFTGTAKSEAGVLKASGNIEMTMDNETTTASFTGVANNIDIPYEMNYRLGYDFDETSKPAFPLAIHVNYTDDNYVVKNVSLQKVYVPGISMQYDFSGTKQQTGYSYQTQDPDDRGAVFGKSYNINLFENSSEFDIEFKEVNNTFLTMLPANASLNYVAQVELFSKKENLLQKLTDTFAVKVRSHFKVFPLVNGEEWMRAGNQALEAGSGSRYYPMGTVFRISVGGQFRVQFIDGTVAVIEYPKSKSYPDVHVQVSLGTSADEGIDGEGNVICKIDQLAVKGAEAGVKKGGKWAVIKLLLSSAKRVNSSVQLFDFIAATQVGGSKPIAVVKLRSVVGIVLGADGSFLLKNYEGHPEVVTDKGSSAVPAGQEFDAATGAIKAITPDEDFDNLKKAVSGKGGGSSSGSFIDKLTGQYKYYAIGGAAVVLLLLVWLLRRRK
jgi:hypothetical protein